MFSEIYWSEIFLNSSTNKRLLVLHQKNYRSSCRNLYKWSIAGNMAAMDSAAPLVDPGRQMISCSPANPAKLLDSMA